MILNHPVTGKPMPVKCTARCKKKPDCRSKYRIFECEFREVGILDIKLNYMAIKNFKGIKEFRLNENGQSLSILGDNATYKTTCYDAFCWVISGKDSFNRADFGIKPLDENGNEVHFLETEVEVELLVDGNSLKLKKVQTENWVKPRGQTEQEYKGNNTAYFFDKVPVGANEYKNRIGEFIGEEVFRLLTNPLYFNEHYKVGKLTDWQSRRMLLFEMCGEMSDEQIVAANQKLAELPNVLDGKSIDDRKAIIAQSIKKLNSEIETIGPKINENTRLIPETSINYSETENRLKTLKLELQGIEKELADAGKVVDVYRKKQQELYVLKGKLENIKSRIDNESGSGRNKLIDEKSSLESERYRIKSGISEYKARIEHNKKSIKNNSDEREQLITKWKEYTETKAAQQALEFVEPDEDNFACPMCGQSLPKYAKEAKLAEMRSNFEAEKTHGIAWAEKKLSQNIEAGKALKSSTEALQNVIDEYTAKLAEAEEKLNQIDNKIADIDIALSEPIDTPDYSTDAEYTEVKKQIDDMQAELDKPVEDITADARQRKADVTVGIEECNKILNSKKVVEDAKARIEELKQSERDLSNQKSKLEGQLNLIQEFIKVKANTLTDTMNSKFKHVRFRLFDMQQNGAIIECCDTMVNTNGKWVPYSGGNTAGRINAGIDIVNALSEHYGVTVPLWVDNAESVTDLVPTKAQVIRLVKPEIRTAEDRHKYSKLNVEVDG